MEVAVNIRGMGRSFKRSRIRRGYTQRKMAKLLGVSNVHLCKLESGQSMPSLGLLKKWAPMAGYKVRLSITRNLSKAPWRRIHA